MQHREEDLSCETQGTHLAKTLEQLFRDECFYSNPKFWMTQLELYQFIH